MTTLRQIMKISKQEADDKEREALKTALKFTNSLKSTSVAVVERVEHLAPIEQSSGSALEKLYAIMRQETNVNNLVNADCLFRCMSEIPEVCNIICNVKYV